MTAPRPRYRPSALGARSAPIGLATGKPSRGKAAEAHLLAALALGLLMHEASGAAPAGATHYGVTLGFEVAQGCAPELFASDPARCETPLYAPYNRDTLGWWRNAVEELARSGVQYAAPVIRGHLDNPRHIGNGNMDPHHLSKLVQALREQGAPFRLALFDDTAAVHGAYNQIHGLRSDLPLDLSADPGDGSGVFSMFWERNWKIFFEVVPDDLLYRVDGRPLVILWSFADAFFRNQRGNISRLMAYLRERCRAERGFDPHIVIDGSAVDEDPTVTERVVEGLHRWFDPLRDGYTRTSWNGRDYSVCVPAFRDHPLEPRPRHLPRNAGATFRRSLDATRGSFLVLVEGHTDVAESAGLYRSLEWERPNLYLDILREYARPAPDEIRLQAEAADAYQDQDPVNHGGAYRLSGGLDIQTTGDGLGWNVGWTAPGEWIEFQELLLPAGHWAVELRIASWDGGTVEVFIDGRGLGTVQARARRDWQAYDVIPAGRIALTTPARVNLRALFHTGGVNLDWIALRPSFPSLTGGAGPASLGAGVQTSRASRAGEIRYSEIYWGLRQIADIRWERDGRGDWHCYVVGEIAGAAAEYLMELGGPYRRLDLTAKADRPGPVRLRIHIDGQGVGEVLFDADNDVNQTLSLDLGALPLGTHAVAIEFLDDHYDGSGRPEGDRNLYLDALRVTP